MTKLVKLYKQFLQNEKQKRLARILISFTDFNHIKT